MINLNPLKKLPLAFIVFFLLGSFSFALDKKDLSPVPDNPQQGCSEENSDTQGSELPPPIQKTTPEIKSTNPDSFLLPPLLPEGAKPTV